ncbi:MAG TPA: hypothetical protein PLV68_08265, partial [Ilumatobacteraceae bacterium]|nr:hypothetical protein [Ilumatobacteraceae bacterium]
ADRMAADETDSATSSETGSAADEEESLTAQGPLLAARDIAVFVVGFVVVCAGLWSGSNAVVIAGAVLALVGVVVPLRSLARRGRTAGAESMP